MKQNNYKSLGQYIQLVDERNRDGAISNLVGVSFEKKIIPSIANTIGTDLSNYRIIKPGQFAYCPVTSRNGERISIALYKGDEKAILSVAYSVFEITKPEELDSEYLLLWVSRPEFDRYARFMSHGSVRELFSWEEMCNVLLPVPPIDEQRRIVAEYQTVERRIKNNETMIQKLEETAQAIYHHTFVEGIDENNLPEGWRKGCLGDICEFAYGKMPDEDKIVDGGYPVYCGYAITKYYSEYTYDKPTIVVIARGDAGSGEIHISPDKFFLSNLGIAVLPHNYEYNNYLLFHLKSLDTYSLRTGSAQAQVTINSLIPFEITIPSLPVCRSYNKHIKVIHENQKSLVRENSHLRTLQSLLTSKLA